MFYLDYSSAGWGIRPIVMRTDIPDTLTMTANEG